MISWILQTKMNVHRTWGNLNNHIGVPLTLLSMNSEHDLSIIELGTNHPGEIASLCAITRPTAGLITNIGRGHLEFFTSIEGVAREKTELFKFISKQGTIFLNRDDRLLPDLRAGKKKIWSYTMDPDQDAVVQGRLIEIDDNGMGIWRLNDKVDIHMKVPGVHNVKNALAASTVALHFAFSETEIKESLESFLAYDKRMQVVRNGNIMIINDSYNANPDSYIPALQTLEHVARKKKSRKIVVIGDMLELGQTGETLHRQLMSSILEYNIDGIFTLGESTAFAAEEFRRQGAGNIYSFENHEELGESIQKYVKPGDIILLKGSRGMQMEKILAYL
jgi:UDP-N-acetylmuramoyl-tripeptide--D-alanyl-D-alanine ligase